MAEWIVERGIGENRAALVIDGAIAAAEIELHETDGGARIGAVLAGRLTAVAGGRAIVTTAAGDVWLERVPPALSIGRPLHVAITREAIPEPGRAKPPRGMPTDAPPCPAPALADRLAATGVPVRTMAPHQPDALEDAGWSELLDEAEQGDIAFAGGTLRMTPTPAMTLFDVDGAGDPAALAIAAARAVAGAIVRHRIGGSIGVDFPTLAGKDARRAVGEAIDAALAPPFERTAMNGFGFLQIVRPRPRASLPELIRADPVGAAARAALRRLSRVPPGAPLAERLPDPVRRRIEARPDWIAELVRIAGRTPILTS